MTIDSGVGNLQTLKQSARATSKFKLLEPTKFSDLNKHYPEKYSKEPVKEELELLGLDDLVKVVFVNSEDMWISVDSCDFDDHGSGLVYGKTCQQAMKLHGLQKGQRVCFDIKCVVEIKYHEDDSDDSEEDED